MDTFNSQENQDARRRFGNDVSDQQSAVLGGR
jgi:hypothetical protein